MGDTESCSSRAASELSFTRNERQKLEVYNEVVWRLRDCNDKEAGFEDELWNHFHRLPARYAMEVNAERAQDVLMHKRLLQMARNPATRPAIEVRLVQVNSQSNTHSRELGHSDFLEAVGSGSDSAGKQSIHPPPAFGSVPNLDRPYSAEDNGSKKLPGSLHSRLMHEITVSTNDKPKLLSQLTSLLSEIGLNIQEAHAFSTVDGYSLDVFVVDNWDLEETSLLRDTLEKEILKIEKNAQLNSRVIYPIAEQEQTGKNLISNHVNIPSDRIDVWEIDATLLKCEKKIASGTYGDMYKGTFRGQDVAIKVLRSEHLNEKLWTEFTQEVFIMRKVRHKNVVQFIGACTKPPSLCIVTEFMVGGSMYDFLHKQKATLDLHSLLRVAIDVCKGMDYLHQNNIIHRDLKAANLLMDENGVVKVADFGVARVQSQSGVMTAETGTYRWMAPEVIEHKPYDHRADIFSFAIVLWELLTGKLPYENLTPLQAAVGVVQQGLRPSIPRNTHPKIVELLERCWQQDPSLRPDFAEILQYLEQLATMIAEERTQEKQREKSARRVVTVVRRGKN